MEVASFIVSLIALSISGLAAFFTWRFHPRADLAPYWDEKRVSRFVDDGVPIVDLTITNTGHAVARDVRVSIAEATADDQDQWMGWLAIDPSQQVTVGIPLVKVRREADGSLTRLTPREAGTLQPRVTIGRKRDWGRGTLRRSFRIKGIGY